MSLLKASHMGQTRLWGLREVFMKIVLTRKRFMKHMSGFLSQTWQRDIIGKAVQSVCTSLQWKVNTLSQLQHLRTLRYLSAVLTWVFPFCAPSTPLLHSRGKYWLFTLQQDFTLKRKSCSLLLKCIIYYISLNDYAGGWSILAALSWLKHRWVK